MNNEDIKSIEIPLDKTRSKQVTEKAIQLMETFFENNYIVELTESTIEEIPILRITKK